MPQHPRHSTAAALQAIHDDPTLTSWERAKAAMKVGLTLEELAVHFIQAGSMGMGAAVGGIPGALVGVVFGLGASSLLVAGLQIWRGEGRKEGRLDGVRGGVDGIELDFLPRDNAGERTGDGGREQPPGA